MYFPGLVRLYSFLRALKQLRLAWAVVVAVVAVVALVCHALELMSMDDSRNVWEKDAKA